MTSTLYKNQRKEAISMPTPANSASSLYTQKLGGGQNLWLLTPVLIILAVIISSSCSSGEESKSSQSVITELTVTINSTDYSITFDADKTKTVIIPYGSTLPAEITVKSATISAKASGLATNDTLKIASGKTDITITAEDGSSTVYTLTVEVEVPIPPPLELTDQELGDRWGFLQVTHNEEDALFFFGVKPANEPAPEKSDMESDLNVKKYSVGRSPINIILATIMGSPLLPFFNAATDDASAQAMWTDTDVNFNGANIMTGNNEFAARRSLLTPETAYKVYILKNGESVIHMMHEFTTAAVDLTATAADLDILSTKLQTETVTFHIENYEVFPLQMKASATPDTAVLTLMKTREADSGTSYILYVLQGTLSMNPNLFPRDNRSEFYFYVGETADYGNSPRLLSIRGFFMTIKKGTSIDPLFPRTMDHTSAGKCTFMPTMNYQQ